MSKDRIEAYFEGAAKLQAIVHGGEEANAGDDLVVLPCPFCGTRPVVAAAGYASITCVEDGCIRPRLSAEYLVDAIAQWNKRDPDTRSLLAAAEARNEIARKALEEIAKHPSQKVSTEDDSSSYAVGWAFWNVQHIAKDAIRSQSSGGKNDDIPPDAEHPVNYRKAIRKDSQ